MAVSASGILMSIRVPQPYLIDMYGVMAIAVNFTTDIFGQSDRNMNGQTERN